jgi:hypothetical protein
MYQVNSPPHSLWGGGELVSQEGYLAGLSDPSGPAGHLPKKNGEEKFRLYKKYTAASGIYMPPICV